MNKQALRRRQLLFFFGLGALAAGGAAQVLRSNSKPTAAADSSRQIISKLASAAGVTNGLPMPEFQGISQWLNSEPLSVADLRGSVVLLQFWTFGCINCKRTLPYITRWHQQYEAQGLKVIGVHTPEFAFERDANNVRRALQEHGITYAVPLDNEFGTWKAYRNRYWPHLFLASREGILVYDHIGEGAYAETERMIQTLLG
ncbi:MAG: thioredoxin family protein [Cyanothece sp. SIO1E1]|nr:thioredoxin family protein [Cyanothece sp. SIO1E1]